MLINGDGVEVNIDKRLEYIEYLCEHGNGEELLEFALMLYKGDNNTM